MQRRIFMVMPVAFTVMFLFFPAGLVLYWVVNNVLSILQQWRITRVVAAKSNA
jgi:YidC/Oxa1 family membrane protein insertase